MALVDLVEESVVKVPLTATDKFGVLDELTEVLLRAGKISDKDAILDALIQRENQGSTGLEQGIAVPHAKTERVDAVTVAIGISPAGVDFEAMDGKPSHVFFCMLAPPSQPGKHVEILSEIARLTKSPTVLKLLTTASSVRDVLDIFSEE